MAAAPLATPEQLPVIDVTPLYPAAAPNGAADTPSSAQSAVAAAMRAACLQTGFFYVTADPGLLPATPGLFWAMRQLFDLPLPDKQALAAALSPLHRGYTGLGGAHNCRPDESAVLGPDNKESFLLGAEGAASRMHGPNTWPDPGQLPGWREAVEAYFRGMLELSRVVARGLALSLGLPEAFFTERMRDPVAQLLLLRYPPPPPELQQAGGAGGGGGAQQQQQQQYVGCGAHTDCGFLTILAQDDVPGLQVRMTNGEWVTAPTIPDTFIVNLGDMTERWTNDLYKSTQHRVFNSSGSNSRYSAPFFCNCDFDAVVEPAAIISGGGAAAKYAPITAGAYILQKLGLMWDEDGSGGTQEGGKDGGSGR